MTISLVGMSGIGKSFWTKKLGQDSQFKTYSIDQLIEGCLEQELRPFGYSGVQGLAHWMGQPWEAGFMQRQLRYLLLERKITRSVIKEVCSLQVSERKKVVIDTTGSIIHCGRDILDDLSRTSSIVHLETPSFLRDQMLTQYIQEPKPVVWGHIFEMREGESHESSLRRSYPRLLSLREDLYRSLAKTTVPYSAFRSSITTAQQFLDLLE